MQQPRNSVLKPSMSGAAGNQNVVPTKIKEVLNPTTRMFYTEGTPGSWSYASKPEIHRSTGLHFRTEWLTRSCHAAKGQVLPLTQWWFPVEVSDYW